eukprot:scaffold7337_cov106-Skeletonema_marinoi.AAC.5
MKSWQYSSTEKDSKEEISSRALFFSSNQWRASVFGFYDDEEEAVAAYARAVFNYKDLEAASQQMMKDHGASDVFRLSVANCCSSRFAGWLLPQQM